VITFFTNVAAGAAWSMLYRASFSVADTTQLQHRLSRTPPTRPFDFQIINKASGSFTPGTYAAYLEHEGRAQGSVSDGSAIRPVTSCPNPDLDAQREAKDAMDTIRSIQSTERVKSTAAAQLALDRIIMNGMLTLVVTFFHCFFTWSKSAIVVDEVLGSFGLLGCLSLGLACMYISAAQLNIMNSCFKEVLFLKEVIINDQSVNFSKKRAPHRRSIGFTQGTVAPWMVRMWDFVGEMGVEDVLRSLLFGPAFSLLPTLDDRARKSRRAEFELGMMVRGHPVVFTTAGTDAHGRDDEGNSLEAINVCYMGGLRKSK
jgi:hypothetical protein